MKRWYEELFGDYAEKYDREAFTQGTFGECDFVERKIAGDRSKRILDVGHGYEDRLTTKEYEMLVVADKPSPS